MAFQIGDRVGDYEVIGVLGAGGMGKVYKVRNVISDRVEAMKVLLPNLADDTSLADRFVREIKLLASLNHPNIAALHTALCVENQLLMIMEFVDGVTLDDLSKLGRIHLRDGIEYVCQALAALSYAHAKGVIHRDIKPANLMLTPQGVIKLMDFGIAKSAAERKLTMTGMTMGSLYYMSPEQVRGIEVDARSDLYSAGISLYELVIGVPPFRGLSQVDLMIAQMQQAPPPPIQVDPNLPQALNEIILHALEKDPAMRFQTADAFRAALESVMNEQQTGAPATASLGTQSTLSQPAQISGPPQAVPPSAVTSPSPPLSLPKPLAPITSCRGLYMAVGAILAIAVIVVLATELPKFLEKHRRAPLPGSVEGSSKETNKPLPHSLALSSGDMVLVEGGEALLRQDRHPVSVESFYIDRTEVTNQAYLMFCDEKRYPVPPGAKEAPDYPVVNITFYEAQDFAKWAKKRLPSALEWEKAARGTKGQIYPWGNDLNFDLANIPRNKDAARSATLASATAYPSGASPYGALNMLGNVWQWVDTPAEVPEEAEFKKYEERVFKNFVPPLSRTEPFYQVRGGSYRYARDDPSALIWDFIPMPARERRKDIGFRCARDVDR